MSRRIVLAGIAAIFAAMLGHVGLGEQSPRDQC